MIARSAAVHSAVRNQHADRAPYHPAIHDKNKQHKETPDDMEKFHKQMHGRKKNDPDEVGPGRRASARARASYRKKIEEMTEDEEVITLFKKSDDGCLGKEGLVHLISALKPNEKIDQTEIDWIMAMADRYSHHRISPDELKDVKAALEAYIKARRNVQHWMTKFDFDRDGSIDPKELQHILEAINDGVPVGDDEVEWVLSNASRFQKGQLTVVELQNAINFWYNHAYEPPDKATVGKHDLKGGAVGRAAAAMTVGAAVA